MTLLLGLREGEVLGLLLADLDLDAASVRIDGTLQWSAGKLVRESAKTQARICQKTLLLAGCSSGDGRGTRLAWPWS
jgi:integrase